MEPTDPGGGIRPSLSEEPERGEDYSGLRGSMIADEPEHLDAATTAAFVEGRLAIEDRHRAADHLATCAACRDEVVAVGQVLAATVARPIWRRPPILAAAAAVVLVAIGVPYLRSGLEDAPLPAPQRNETTAPGGLVAIAPAADAMLGSATSTTPIRFLWHAAEPGSRFRLSVVDERGETIWSLETGDTSAALPATIRLEVGRSYFWFVDALSTGGRSLSTGAQRFTVR